jgi:putative endonuclease
VKIVYLLRSIPVPGRYYIGLTDDLEARLAVHNSGLSIHTAKFRPWKLVLHIKFDSGQMAFEFERYLKSGSGRAFAKRHF